MPELPDCQAHTLNHESRGESSNIDFLDVALLLGKNWRRILIVGGVAFLLGAVVSFVMQPTFTAIAVILPPQQQQSSASAILGQLGSLAGLGGASGNVLRNPADLYVAILQSRTIADGVIEKFHLQDVYRAKDLEASRRVLKSHSKFEALKAGLITVTVEEADAQRASDLANAYIDGLYRLNSELAITEAAQRRVFFDKELQDEKSSLANAENDLKATQQKTGLIQLNGQAEIILRSIAEIRAEIASKEVEIQSIGTFATDQNPQAVRAQQEISSLRSQLASLENSQRKIQPGDVEVPAGRVPEAALEYLRKYRDVKFHESLFELLSKQYEAARIDEAKSAPVIQVVDRAIPPGRRSGPHRALIALGAGFLGLLFACVWVLVRQGYRRMEQVPENAARLQELRRVFRSRG